MTIQLKATGQYFPEVRWGTVHYAVQGSLAFNLGLYMKWFVQMKAADDDVMWRYNVVFRDEKRVTAPQTLSGKNYNFDFM